MSMKPVKGIILAADRDLVVVAHDRPEVAGDVDGLTLHSDGDLTVEGSEMAQGYDDRTLLLLHGSEGGVGTIAMEPEVVERLQRMGVYRHVHLLEGRSASLAARLVCALARHARLAVDNDLGGLLSGEEFCDLTPEAQAEFVLGIGFGEDGDVTRAETAAGAS